MDPGMVGALIGAAVASAIAAAGTVWRAKVNRKSVNGHGKPISLDDEQAGRMAVPFWQHEFRVAVREELQPVIREIQDATKELQRLSYIIDPSGHTPGGGNRAPRIGQ